MPRNYETNFGKFFKLPNQGLRSYFGNVVKGQPIVYDTPFARGESTEQMLSNWNNVLESIAKDWPTLYDYEIDLMKKVGPMSVVAPLKQRMSDIDAYYDGIHLPSAPIDERAMKASLSEWKGVSLRTRNINRTIELMKKSTNSGSPYFTKRRNVVNDTLPAKISIYKDSVSQQLRDATYDACAVLGWRGQEGGPTKEDVKQRVVWMFPFAVNIRELQVYQPIIEAAQKLNIVPAWVSMDEVDRRITRLFDSKGEDAIVCTDFTKFDQHFNASLQECAKYQLDKLLTKDVETRYWLEEVYPIKYMIPLAYNWNTIRYGRHGMGSGSGGTNADETLAHRALQYESAIANGARLNPNSQCLGDDGILSYPGITVEDVVETYRTHGLEMNETKQYVSTQDCTYLRRWHHKNYRVSGICVGVYSTMRALGRLRYLERFQNPEYWDEKMVALRQLSIIENVKYHPLKDQFAEFCMKRDKYRLGIDIPGFLDSIEQIAYEAIDHMPDFLGYTKTLQADFGGVGISSWWIVKYLKSKT